MYRLTIALLALMFLAAGAQAQRRGGWAGPPQVTPTFAQGFGSPHRGSNSGVFYAGDPFFYGDAFYQPAVQYAPPQVILVESRPAVVDDKPEPKAEPLLIEWQGDRYVRYSGSDQQAQRNSTAPVDYQEPASRPVRSAPAELPPAVLVYRDGHREKVSDYSIISGTIYARGNYWRDGYWNKNIEVSSLDIPATMKASQDNGVKFVLPSAPNEVITRP